MSHELAPPISMCYTQRSIEYGDKGKAKEMWAGKGENNKDTGRSPKASPVRRPVTSTPMPKQDRAAHTYPTLGHDDLPSPISKPNTIWKQVWHARGQQSDVHPRGGNEPPSAHDGLPTTELTDDQPADHVQEYIHPVTLAANRMAEWPQPLAVANDYPQLAYIYSAVVQTGVPNSLDARLTLPTALQIHKWEAIATGHRDDVIVLDGVRYGFPSQYWGPPRPTLSPGYNHTSADAYPNKIREYVKKELDEGAIIGPFTTAPFEWVHYSPLMTRPKASQDGLARRVIVDLSFPQGQDINLCISKNVYNGQQFRHTLPTVDNLVDIIREMEYKAFLYSIDIARAYRNFHSDPLDWPLQGIAFAGELLIDTALLFGSRNSLFFMQKIAEFIARHLTMKGACVLIYLDDLVGVASTMEEAEEQYAWCCELLGDLGLPLAVNKLAPPSQGIQWLGIKCDVPTRMLSIPEEKVKEALQTITNLHSRSAMSRKEVQQLAGKINYIARVCRPARLFMSRILAYLRAHPPG